jgi:hypothetical protein
MIGAYFSDMAAVLGDVRKKLNDGACVWMVVGDSRYASVDVPVGAILDELAPSLGFAPVSNSEFRHMRTSPQQGGAKELPESLLVWRTDS